MHIYEVRENLNRHQNFTERKKIVGTNSRNGIRLSLILFVMLDTTPSY